MTTIYVVTSGSYSDYGIDAIFDTREAAAAYAIGDDREIEEHELNTIAAKERMYWCATIRYPYTRDGVQHPEITIDPSPELFATDPPRIIVNWRPAEHWERARTGGLRYMWSGTAYGKSPEHARKILADEWAEARANVEAVAFTKPEHR